MTDQESNSSNEQASPEIIHAKLIMGIGILGEKADVQRFTDLLAADFNMRAQRCATKIFKGRIQLLPVEAEIPEDDEVQ